MKALRGLVLAVRRSVVGAVSAVVLYPVRVRRGEAKLPQRKDFRPSRPGNWTIRTRMLIAAMAPMAVVVAIDAVGGRMNPINLAVFGFAAVIAVSVAQSVTRPIELVIAQAS